MNAKNLLSIMLLLFVGSAVVVLIVREVGRDKSQTAPVEADVLLPTSGLVAYYFHGETRCPTCRNIEAYAREAIHDSFSAELSSGEVLWRVVNYESAENAHFVADYEIASPTVVIVQLSKGKQTAWRNLARVWELVGEKDAFVKYVQQQTAELLVSTPD